MALFSKAPEEDHGHGLLAEFEELVSGLAERVTHRSDIVKSRLAALEQEDGVLNDLGSRLHAHKS